MFPTLAYPAYRVSTQHLRILSVSLGLNRCLHVQQI